MSRREYKYTGGLQYLNPWEIPYMKRKYSRSKFRKETLEIIIDETTWDDVDYYKDWYERNILL